MDTIAARLEHARTLRGFSARGLSIEAGIAQSIAAQIEAGTIKDPRGETIVALARVLDVDAGWLLEGKGRGPANDTDPTPEAA